MSSPVEETAGARPVEDSRLRLRRILMVSGPALLIAAALYFYLTGGRYQSTDDAYVETSRVAISSNIPGRVREVAVRENQHVREGDVLFRLDDAPLGITVDEAAAKLASARLRIESLKASYRQRAAALRAARDTVAFQEREYERQKRLLPSGISSQVQVDRAQHALEAAQSEVLAAQQQLSETLASLGGSPDIAPDRHPAVREAQAALDRARLELSYAVIKAPSDGIVTRVDRLRPGTYITAASPVFALVSGTDIWVEANFKEDQLERMRPGQAAEVELDAYPGKQFSGRVASLSPGTGSQFSALPAENATGNWVKVVQRLPVRIALDKLDPEFPLHAGLSANVKVDTKSTSASPVQGRTTEAR